MTPRRDAEREREVLAQQASTEQRGWPVFPLERPLSAPELFQMSAWGLVVQGLHRLFVACMWDSCI